MSEEVVEESLEEENRRLREEIAKAKNAALKQELAELQAASEDSDPETEEGLMATRWRRFLFWVDNLGYRSLLVVALVAILASVGFVWGIANLSKSDGSLNQSVGNYEITALNTDAVPFSGGAYIAGTSSAQKGLSSNGDDPTDPPAFIWRGNSKAVSTLEIYMDISDQRSRDFLLMNRVAIENLIKSGKTSVAIHLTPVEDPFATYAGEALAQIFANNAKVSWSTLFNLLRASAVAENDGWSSTEALKQVSKLVAPDGVSKKQVQSGDFANWLYSTKDDPRLASGISLPGIFGVRIDNASVNVNSTEDFLAEFDRLVKD